MRIFQILIAVAALFSFVSCQSDDDFNNDADVVDINNIPNGNNPGNNNGGNANIADLT